MRDQWLHKLVFGVTQNKPAGDALDLCGSVRESRIDSGLLAPGPNMTAACHFTPASQPITVPTPLSWTPAPHFSQTWVDHWSTAVRACDEEAAEACLQG